MNDTYTHRLDPRTDANLTAAILAVGNLLGVSPIADSILEHLKDRIGDTLNPAQRSDPHSVFSSDILGRLVESVKETYGIDKPANMHAAPQGPQARETPIGSDSVFALDGLGRNRFEQMTGGTGGDYVRRLAAVGTSSAAYGALMAPWNPASGAGGLNEFNFGTSPFASPDVGLDLSTSKALLGQGFTTPQVIAAGKDRQALGLSGQESAINLAYIRKANPQHITSLKNYRSDSLADAAAYATASQDAAQADAEGRPEEAAQYRRLMAEIETRQKAERERIAAEAADPQIQTRINQEADKIWGNNKEAYLNSGLDPAVIEEVRTHPENPKAVRAYRQAYTTALEDDPTSAPRLEAVDQMLEADRELHGKALAENVETAEQNAVIAEANDSKEDSLTTVDQVSDDGLDLFNNPIEPSTPGEPAAAAAEPASDQPAEAAQAAPSPEEPTDKPLKPKVGANGLVAGPN